MYNLFRRLTWRLRLVWFVYLHEDRPLSNFGFFLSFFEEKKNPLCDVHNYASSRKNVISHLGDSPQQKIPLDKNTTLLTTFFIFLVHLLQYQTNLGSFTSFSVTGGLWHSWNVELTCNENASLNQPYIAVSEKLTFTARLCVLYEHELTKIELPLCFEKKKTLTWWYKLWHSWHSTSWFPLWTSNFL